MTSLIPTSKVLARNGSVIAITDEGNCDLDDKCDFVIKMPEVEEFLVPLLAGDCL